jgi:CHAT domain-containing protein
MRSTLNSSTKIKKLSHGKIFESNKASEASFKAEAGRFRVLHIASHTVLDSVNPFLSCMVLTAQDSVDDGHLYAYEISQLKLNAQLVVLSGCNTGYGILRRSEGLISIARSFFYTGVRTIAYTLWPVADKAGFALSELFYQGVKKDQQMDVAMRNAKLEYLKNADPVKTHPYYWANYIIVGNTDSVPLKKYPLLPLLLISLPILLVLLYFIGIRKHQNGG